MLPPPWLPPAAFTWGHGRLHTGCPCLHGRQQLLRPALSSPFFSDGPNSPGGEERPDIARGCRGTDPPPPGTGTALVPPTGLPASGEPEEVLPRLTLPTAADTQPGSPSSPGGSQPCRACAKPPFKAHLAHYFAQQQQIMPSADAASWPRGAGGTTGAELLATARAAPANGASKMPSLWSGLQPLSMGTWCPADILSLEIFPRQPRASQPPPAPTTLTGTLKGGTVKTMQQYGIEAEESSEVSRAGAVVWFPLKRCLSRFQQKSAAVALPKVPFADQLLTSALGFVLLSFNLQNQNTKNAHKEIRGTQS